MSGEGWHCLARGETRLASGGVAEGSIAEEGDKSPTFKSPCPTSIKMTMALNNPKKSTTLVLK
jgi:hypothetical protein